MNLHLKRALQDIRDNRFLTAVTVATIALSILILSAFTLVWVNAGEAIRRHKEGLSIMVYIQPGADVTAVKERLTATAGVQAARFISKAEAMAYLRERMARQDSLFEGLKENPLPEAFEVRLAPSIRNAAEVEHLASLMAAGEGVGDVEYAAQWFGRLSHLIGLFRLLGYALGALFFMAAVFIVANTVRLVLYSRRQEVEIMRLVGASDRFIKAPFYLEGVIQGAVGGLLGITALGLTYGLVSANLSEGLSAGWFHLRFLSWVSVALIWGFSLLAGWLGSYLSLRQLLRS